MRLVALVPCDLVQVDTETRKIAIVGPFGLAQGPIPLRLKFAVYVRVECGPGKHVVEVFIRKQGQSEGVRLRNEVDVKRTEREEELVDVPFGMITLTFKEEGRYVVEAFGDGELLGSTWFDVVKKAVLFLPAAGAGQQVGRKNGAQIPTFDQARR